MLEVRAQEAVETFRETAGPWDIDMAKVSEIDVDTTQLLFDISSIDFDWLQLMVLLVVVMIGWIVL